VNEPTPGALAAGEPAAAGATPESMRAYYVQRAAHYERVYHKPERQADLRAMEAWIAGPFAGRRVLEVAAGTGWWTPHAARDAKAWLATDINAQTLALAKAKPMPACVRFAEVDAYTFEGLASEETFDAAFAGCWWSHVDLRVLPGWLLRLHTRLEPGARVVFLDNSFVQTSSTPITRRDGAGNTYQQRTLDDGSVHEVLKNFPTPAAAIACLGPRAIEPRWIAHTHYWILSYGLR
jgi:demethylmenaquinone methyltransferase/2-methoxy-6-polyprenyl-1,4-benzoquinol methylase